MLIAHAQVHTVEPGVLVSICGFRKQVRRFIVHCVDVILRFATKELRFAQKEPRFAQKELRFAQKELRFAQKELRFVQKELSFSQKELRFAQKELRFAQKLHGWSESILVSNICNVHTLLFSWVHTYTCTYC